jgi:putative Mn2+ efflux pump MntP
MNLITVLILALGLCFDSFAVSLSHGLAQCGYGRMHFFRFSLVLALFQGAFPLIGWGVAAGFQHYIARYDHWVAFILLAALGVRMIVESRKEAVTPECFRFDLRHTLTLGVAPSIDALITGAAMAMVTIQIVPQAGQWGNMLTASGIIFAVTFFACFLGIVLGRTAGNRLGKHAEIAGGIILIAIGIKILMEHLFS